MLEDGDIRSYVDPERLKKRGPRAGTNEETINGLLVVLPSRQSRACLPDLDGHVSLHPAERGVPQGTGEARKQLSWIWTTSKALNIDDNTDDNDNVLRLEWCRSRARAMRAKEEVLKVREEMMQTLRYLEWCAKGWEGKSQQAVKETSQST